MTGMAAVGHPIVASPLTLPSQSLDRLQQRLPSDLYPHVCGQIRSVCDGKARRLSVL